MEIQSANSLQDTIHNLYTQAKHDQQTNFSRLLLQADQLVALFNDHELSSPKGVLSSTDYQIFLTAHLIVHDTTNAKYLWKRIPKSLKKLEKPVNANN